MNGVWPRSGGSSNTAFDPLHGRIAHDTVDSTRDDRGFHDSDLVGGVFFARAETWPLELKRLPPVARPGAFSASDYAYRATYPQNFFFQLDRNGKNFQDSTQTATFQRIVKKEPTYECDQPFRGVIKLGSQEYAFALDRVSPPGEKAKDKEDKEAKEETKKPAADSLLAKLTEKLVKAADAVPKAITYNRLYFDFNHNGDLTDDPVVDSTSPAKPEFNVGGGSNYSRIEFPQIDVTIEAGDSKMDYSFTLSGYARSFPGNSFVSISANAAAYREGDITLEGKKHHVVLLDFNSNGRFDDETTVSDQHQRPMGQLYPELGDVLLIDPDKGNLGFGSPYDWTASDNRVPVSKVVCIDGRLYDMKITPAGDQLTLTPSTAPPAT